jgi:hypothetical protein
MTKQFLHHSKICSGIKHMGGKRVTEPVGCDWPHQSQLSNRLVKKPSNGTSRQTSPKAVQEQGLATYVIHDIARTPQIQVDPDTRQRFLSHWRQALLIALAQDPNQAPVEIDVSNVHPH